METERYSQAVDLSLESHGNSYTSGRVLCLLVTLRKLIHAFQPSWAYYGPFCIGPAWADLNMESGT